MDERPETGIAAERIEEGRLLTAPAASVVIRDTVGAGDWFMAGLMVGLTRGVDTPAILENACPLGAYVASHHGATPLLSKEIVEVFRRALYGHGHRGAF